MAQIAIDDQESGETSAAPELHAFCVAHLDEIVVALGQPEEARALACETIRNFSVEAFPKALLATCRAPNIRQATRDIEGAKKDARQAEAAACVVAGIDLNGVSYQFNGADLAELARLSPASGDLYLTAAGYPYGLCVPVQALRALHKIKPLGGCLVHMTSPLASEWRFIVQWSTAGYAQWRKVVTPTFTEMVHVCAPSMVDLVSRELEREGAKRQAA